MAITYKAIATTTVGSGGATNIEFTSIPGTYTDLILFISTRLTGTGSAWQGSVQVTFNNSTTNYSNRLLTGDGSNAASYNNTSAFLASFDTSSSGSGQTASTFSNIMLYIPNYTSSNNKAVSADSVAENNSQESGLRLTAALWSNSAAITSIKIVPESGYGNLSQYSTATLYGIKATV